MSKHKNKAKSVVAEFGENLKDFDSVLRAIEKKGIIEEKDFKKLKDARKGMAISTRAYLNDLGANPEVIRLVTPLMNGELDNVTDPDFMGKIEHFKKNFGNVTANVKKELHTRSESELLEMFGGVLKDSKDIQSLEIKIGAIQNKFTAELNKNKTK